MGISMKRKKEGSGVSEVLTSYLLHWFKSLD